jgi:hypothetical protein
MNGSTATIPLIFVSTLNLDSYTGPTLTTSTLIAVNTYASSIITSSISVNTYYLNQAVYGQTIKKDSIDVFTDVTLQASDIIAFIDNAISTSQTYTIGPAIQNRYVATGINPTIAYSDNGINWSSSVNGNIVLSTEGNGVAWNGNQWIAVGGGTHSIAYSYDGMTWMGSSSPLLTGYGIAWGYIWVAVGDGTYQIVISSDGILWTGVDNTVFGPGNIGYGVAFNEDVWVAVGIGANRIAYSINFGYTWLPSATGSAILNIVGRGIAWNGNLWVAVGRGTTYSIAYSYDGIKWTGAAPSSMFLETVNGVAWNGTLWVAVSGGITNTIATSTDGITWIGRGNTIHTSTGLTSWSGASVTWNGSLWIAAGVGLISIVTSTDGIYWFGNAYSQSRTGIAFNFLRSYTLTIQPHTTSSFLTPVQSVSIPIIVPANSQLDIVSNSYYNSGYTNFSIALQTHAS